MEIGNKVTTTGDWGPAGARGEVIRFIKSSGSMMVLVQLDHQNRTMLFRERELIAVPIQQAVRESLCA